MTFAGTTLPPGGDETALLRNFWRKLARVFALIPFAEDLLTVYYCALDNDTPRHVKLTLFGAIAYFVLPTDAVPDFLPALGYTDDAAVLAATIKLVTGHITPAHQSAAKEQLKNLSSS